jgi:hypothetical protein
MTLVQHRVCKCEENCLAQVEYAKFQEKCIQKLWFNFYTACHEHL